MSYIRGISGIIGTLLGCCGPRSLTSLKRGCQDAQDEDTKKPITTVKDARRENRQTETQRGNGGQREGDTRKD